MRFVVGILLKRVRLLPVIWLAVEKARVVVVLTASSLPLDNGWGAAYGQSGACSCSKASCHIRHQLAGSGGGHSGQAARLVQKSRPCWQLAKSSKATWQVLQDFYSRQGTSISCQMSLHDQQPTSTVQCPRQPSRACVQHTRQAGIDGTTQGGKF